MRQIGYLAAAGIYALHNNVERLAEDHNRAKIIADSLQKMHCIENLRPVETNIILFDVKEAYIAGFKKILESKNIQPSFLGSNTVRFVTNLGFSDDHLEVLCLALKKLN